MTVYQNLNQFAQTPIKGDVAGVPNPSTLSCQLTTASSNTPKAGYLVKLIAGTANTILVEQAGPTDVPFGFIVFNPKKDTYAAGDQMEVAISGSVINLETAGSFNRGQNVEFVTSGGRVQVYGGTNNICGVALDTATAAGQIVRVLVRTVAEYSSSSSSSSCRSSSSSSSSSAT